MLRGVCLACIILVTPAAIFLAVGSPNAHLPQEELRQELRLVHNQLEGLKVQLLNTASRTAATRPTTRGWRRWTTTSRDSLCGLNTSPPGPPACVKYAS